jgi:hypothetical protein
MQILKLANDTIQGHVRQAVKMIELVSIVTNIEFLYAFPDVGRLYPATTTYINDQG